MFRSFAPALPLLALAACGQPEARTVAADYDRKGEQAAKLAGADSFVPGRWESKTRIRSVEDADLDPQTRREIVGQESALDQCLPQPESRRPDANFFAGGDGSECEYTQFAMQGGQLAATMACTATPGTITLSVSGGYTPTSYALDATATTSGVPGAPMTTTARLEGRWIGECAATAGVARSAAR